MTTLGKKISTYRKSLGLTQEELAEKLNLSSQAISKWENDLSIPDITIMLALSDLFQISLDDLVRQEENMHTPRIVPKEQRKPLEQMILRIIIQCNSGDQVKVNLPMLLFKAAIESGISDVEDDEGKAAYGAGFSTNMLGNNGQSILNNIDLQQIMLMADSGVIGKLVEINSSDGDYVEIFIE